MEAFDGDIATDTKTGAVTVKLAEALVTPDDAVMLVSPCATLVARPAPFTLATDGADELQFTEFVRFCELPSLYAPMAVNCCEFPATTLAVVGVTLIDTRTGGPTLNRAEP